MILSHHSLDGFMNTVKNILVMLHKVSSVNIVIRLDGAVGVSTTSFVWLALRTTKILPFVNYYIQLSEQTASYDT